jgi:NAD(P)-dependent dehydrogenase (short-subunit alcohol dehydrogenase family)
MSNHRFDGPRFQDRVMVVTGAAQGIGQRVAERAAAEGARLVLVAVSYTHLTLPTIYSV